MVEPLPSLQGALGLISSPEKRVTGQFEGKKPHIFLKMKSYDKNKCPVTQWVNNRVLYS